MSRSLAGLLACLAFASGGLGCDAVEKWISKKADERIARAVDSAEDSLDDEDEPPSGVKSTAHVSKKKKKKSAPPPAPPPSSESSLTASPSGSSGAAPPLTAAKGPDFLKDPPLAFKAFKDKPCPTHFIELILWRGRGRLVAEDPKAPGAALEYALEGEHVSDGKRPLIAPNDMSTASIDIATVDPKVLAAVAANAPERLARPTSETEYVVVERDLPFETDVVIRAYLGGGQYAEFDAKGKWISNH